MVDDVILRTAGAGEVSMRLRLAADRHRQQARRRPEADRFALDEADRSVRVCGRRLTLTYTEFEILCCLARRPGQVVAHATILDHLYNGEPRGTSRTVQTHLRRIRVKLGPEHAGLIQTVHGIGYRLRADLRGSVK
jgi:DNA-binding response OmpR family regulator